MKARIYRPAKTAMQSGTANTRSWILEYVPACSKSIDPLMGWTGSSDMQQQVKLTFHDLSNAEAFAKKQGLEYAVKKPHKRKRNIQSYADNFKS